ncbi:MAG: hypothetical protein GF375_00495 [Candidatus Omnitrophica bacterium]|nr:hypothetical protein [Candidatus Omnitrophota bacterium]
MVDLKNNNEANVSIIAIYLMTIISLGALYTLLFLEFAIPNLGPLIPDDLGTFKTATLTIMYAIPLIITVVCSLAVLKNALKREVI